MRMWMVDPKILCQHHLMFEHLSLHAFMARLNLGYSLLGYVEHNLVEVAHLGHRHRVLVGEMVHRGLNHNSELPQITNTSNYQAYRHHKVDRAKAISTLLGTCPRCRERYNSQGGK